MAGTLHPHIVHADAPFEVDDEPVRTYDSDRAPAGAKPDGEDITPASQRVTVESDNTLSVTQVPEQRVPYWLISNPTRTYTGPLDCPDCGLGLSSRGGDFICPRLGRGTQLWGDHDGDIIACGLTDG